MRAGDRRMRVEQHLDQAGRLLFGEILCRQPLHRGDERRRVPRHRQRVAIGAALVRARERVRHRHQRQRDRARGEHAAAAAPRRRPCPRRPSARRKRAEHEIGHEAAERDQHGLDDDRRPDIAIDVMRELVRQDHFDLVIRVLGQQRVGQEDAPRAPDAGQRGVRLLGAIAEPPFEDAGDARPGPVGQGHEPIAERVPRQRRDRRRRAEAARPAPAAPAARESP